MLPASVYLWDMRTPHSVKNKHVVHASFTGSLHHVETILQLEVPLVASALRVSGLTASAICNQWIRQCFINFLDWTEVGSDDE